MPLLPKSPYKGRLSNGQKEDFIPAIAEDIPILHVKKSQLQQSSPPDGERRQSENIRRK
jgi:hypothetical protein